jgi:hypothetical protein
MDLKKNPNAKRQLFWLLALALLLALNKLICNSQTHGIAGPRASKTGCFFLYGLQHQKHQHHQQLVIERRVLCLLVLRRRAAGLLGRSEPGAS